MTGPPGQRTGALQGEDEIESIGRDVDTVAADRAGGDGHTARDPEQHQPRRRYR